MNDSFPGCCRDLLYKFRSCFTQIVWHFKNRQKKLEKLLHTNLLTMRLILKLT